MYLYSLKDYKAIKSAQIRIDGITVLAGVNGSGKSTLSRWLYYLINAEHEFERFQRTYFIHSLEEEIEKIQRVFRTSSLYSAYSHIRRQMRRYAMADEDEWDGLKEIYFSFIRKAEDDLSSYVEEHDIRGRVASYLIGNDVGGELDPQKIINRYIQECEDAYEKGYDQYLQIIGSYSRKDLERVVRSEYSDGEPIPSSLSLQEDKMPLLEENRFVPPLLLRRAVYIDTPMGAFDGNLFGNDIWQQFSKYINTVNPDRAEEDVQLIKLQIQSVIGGGFKEVDDEFELEKEFHYVSKDKAVDINIKEAATGIKSFAYMYRLIENGWLDKYSLLLIDEPEAHLHPQWIVEFARLLVKIHKDLGVKIVIASHNPDMISAIQSIAAKEQVIDHTVFYLAEKDVESARFIFMDKGLEIGDIFASFNIALTRIEMYGSTML